MTREKRGCFFRLNAMRESRLVVKMCLFFRKRVLLDSIKGHLGVIFQTPQNMSSKKSLFMGKFWEKIVQNACLGDVFPGEGKSRLGYVLKTSGHKFSQKATILRGWHHRTSYQV